MFTSDQIATDILDQLCLDHASQIVHISQVFDAITKAIDADRAQRAQPRQADYA